MAECVEDEVNLHSIDSQIQETQLQLICWGGAPIKTGNLASVSLGGYPFFFFLSGFIFLGFLCVCSVMRVRFLFGQVWGSEANHHCWLIGLFHPIYSWLPGRMLSSISMFHTLENSHGTWKASRLQRNIIWTEPSWHSCSSREFSGKSNSCPFLIGFLEHSIWMFPKIVVPPNHPF